MKTQSFTSLLVLSLAAMFAVVAPDLFGQSALVDFNTPGQFTNNFSVRSLAAPTVTAVWFESSSGGANGSGSLDGINNGNDTTATYGADAFDFSADGKTLNVSMMVKIRSSTTANRVLQLGFISNTNLALNDNTPTAFMSVRLNSTTTALSYNVELQQRPANGPILTTNTSAALTLTAGNWYQLSASFRNIKGTLANGYRVLNANLQDMGANGITPGAVLWTTNNIDFTNIDLTADAAVYPSFRSIETTGVDNLDNFAVWMTNGAPVITAAPVNQTVTSYRPASFSVKVDGTPGFSYTWYTNGVVVAGANSGTLSFAQVPVALNGTTIQVAVTNSIGGVVSSPVTLTVSGDAVAPSIATVGSLDGNVIGVAFNEVVTAATANNPANYSITPSATVTSAVLQPDGTRVKLTLGSTISGGFSVTASGIADNDNNVGGGSASGTVMGLTPSDLAFPAYAGSAISYNTGDIDEVGGGADFAGNVDQGHITMAPRSGDFDLAVRVASIGRVYPFSTLGTGRDEFSKAILMVRETTQAGARNVQVLVNPPDTGQPMGGNIIQMFNRTTYLTGAGQVGGNISLPTAAVYSNVWLRLRRVNNTFTAYYQTNNATPGPVWYQAGQVGNLLLNDTLLAGVAVSAHYDADRPVAAQFRSFGNYAVVGASIAVVTNPVSNIPLLISWPATNGTVSLSMLASNTGSYFPSNEIQFILQRADNLGNFTNVQTTSAAATATPTTNSAAFTVTTPLLGLADNGTRFRIIAKGPDGITATSSVATVNILYADFASPTVVNTSLTLGSNSLALVFNEPLDPTTLATGNFVITNSLGQAITVSSLLFETNNIGTNNVYRLVLYTGTALTNNTAYFVRINNVKGQNGALIANNTIATMPTLGTVKIEIFNNLTGTALDYLTNFTFTPKYFTNLPDYVFWTNAWNWQNTGTAFSDKFNNYGGRMSGHFIAPSNGSYRFYVRGDDAFQFWMNTNALNSWDPNGKTLLCYQTNNVPTYGSTITRSGFISV